jgi:hypothetical protein
MQTNKAIAVEEFREYPGHCARLRPGTNRGGLVSQRLRDSIQEVLCWMLLEVVCLPDGESESGREDRYGKDSGFTAGT